jgi:serine/threonine protein kinase
LIACHRTTYTDEFGFSVTSVCHGDIKPDNILVDAHGTPYLIDFLQIDVQRLADVQNGVMASLRVPKTSWFGTVGFMHPDQERLGIVSPETDTYSLRTVVQKMTTGHPPSLLAVKKALQSLVKLHGGDGDATGR